MKPTIPIFMPHIHCVLDYALKHVLTETEFVTNYGAQHALYGQNTESAPPDITHILI